VKTSFFALLVSMLLLIACSDKRTAGGVTDIGNSVAGVILDSLGTPVVGAKVSLFSYRQGATSSVMIDTLLTLTGSDGHYRFEGVDTGAWMLVGSLESLGAIHQLLIAGNLDSMNLHLSVTKVVRGHALLLAGSHVFVAGYPSSGGTISKDGSFQLDSIPAGDYNLCFASNGYTRCKVITTTDHRDTLDVPDLHPESDSIMETVHYAADSIPAYYLGKDFGGLQSTAATSTETPYLRKVTILWPGSAPAAAVFEFPLAVRLDASKLDFKNFRGDGADLRVLDFAAKPLSFEIESWDSAHAQALLWVSLSQVAAGQTGVNLWLTRDPLLATQGGMGSAVFSPAAGFQAVYHMNVTGDSLPDAGANHHNGLLYNNPTPQAGTLGQGLRFGNDSTRVELGTWDPCGTDFTMSLWAYWDGLDNSHQILLSKRSAWDGGKTRWQWHYDFLNDSFATYQIAQSDARFPATGVPLQKWVYLTLVYRADLQLMTMYADGVLLGEPQSFTPGSAVDAPLRIGGDDVGEAWNGALDEVRIESVARNFGWIALSHVTQAPD